MNYLPHATRYLSQSPNEPNFIARLNFVKHLSSMSLRELDEAMSLFSMAAHIKGLCEEEELTPEEDAQVCNLACENRKATVLAIRHTHEELLQVHKLLSETRKGKLLYQRMTNQPL